MYSINPFVLIILLFLACLETTLAQIPVSVDLVGIGTVRGQSAKADSVQEFLGVPYAEPPVGQFRFARPIRKAAWENDWDATAFRAVCPQPAPDTPLSGLVISEDCLFLNILVPPEASGDNFPVMVFIPGRGDRLNAGSEYDGHEMADNGIIVVTINYRFFTFGFFSTDDDFLPGNYGLWDQRLAIEWVRDNIGAFGGDSSRITIAGQGRAGAAQLFSPLNNNELFQRAILHSNQFTDTSYIMTSEQAKSLSSRLADNLNCNQSTWRERLVCLRAHSWEDILAASDYSRLLGYFEPRIDGYFFPEPLENLLDGDQVLQYDVLAGANSDEGIILINGLFDINALIQNVSDVNSLLLNEFRLRYGDEERASLAINALAQEYQDPLVGLPDRDSALRYIFDIFGDGFYISNLVKFLRRHTLSSETNTFMYYFDFVDGNSDYTLISDSVRDPQRAVQGEELFYIWDTIFGMNSPMSDEGSTVPKILRGNMLHYWVNFVKTGDPNFAGNFVWPHFGDTESYLWITSTVANSLATAQNLKIEFTSFWLDYIPELTDDEDADQCRFDAPASDTLRGVLKDDREREFVILNITNGDSYLGQVRGIIRKSDEGIGGKEIRYFRGIPYTLPPVDARRFEYSEVLSDWGDDIYRNATSPSPGCPQGPALFLAAEEYNEDCLYLNVFTPVVPDDGDKLPVIVYVHSGQYIGGNGVVFDGTALASYGDAVVVTLNYRVGALGFLSTADDVAPGNYGIMDVVTALKWIQNYIGSFGGDAGNVTAFGMGTGTAIIHMISLNGLNDGLMHKMILLGESILSPPTLTSSARDPLPFATELANALDCPTESTSELISCLKTKTADEIISGQSSVSGSNLFQLSFPPVWDGTILKDSPINILASGEYETLPTLMGGTENDNTVITALYINMINESVAQGCPDEKYAGAIIENMVDIFYDGKNEFAELLKMFYLKSDLSPTVPSDCPAGQQISELLSDIWLNVPHFEVGRQMARFNKEMYLYSLTFYPEVHVLQLFLPPWAKTSFGDDMPYAFGWPYDQEAIQQHGINFNSDDRKVAINFMEMISSFAKTGVPSANPTDPDSVWEPFDPLKYNALFLDVCPTQELIPRAAEKDTLWNTLIPALMEALSDDGEEPTPSTMPCMVGSFIGLELTEEEAGRIIGALIITFAVIAAVVVMGIAMKVCLKMSRKSSANKPV